MRSRISAEQAKLELNTSDTRSSSSHQSAQRPQRPQYQQRPSSRKVQPTAEEKKKFKEMLEDLIGTRGAYLLDEKLNILGKVPLSELTTTINSLSSGVYAVVLDGTIDKDLTQTCEKSRIKFLIARESKIKNQDTRATIMTTNDL